MPKMNTKQYLAYLGFTLLVCCTQVVNQISLYVCFVQFFRLHFGYFCFSKENIGDTNYEFVLIVLVCVCVFPYPHGIQCL